MAFYTDAQRDLQDEFDSRNLADAVQGAIIDEELNDYHKMFIESRDYFFLSTVNDRGEPTVSFKGGDVGTVTVIDDRHVAFPIYDGNGMFLSVGNMSDTAKVGLLFIDFETPQRIRVQGEATLHRDDELLSKYPGAKLVVRVEISNVFLNCARYIHPHTRVETSRYIPDANGDQPYPAWKRIDGLQGSLHPDDEGKAELNGGVITEEEYGAKLAVGES